MPDGTPKDNAPFAETDDRLAGDVIDTEIAALHALKAGLDGSFSRAVDLVTGCMGHVIVSGVGKSGHIGAKISASLASTGTPSFFLHPTEASHGDLGMVTANCVILALSYSGESRELTDVLRFAKRQAVPIIGMTRAADSTLGRFSDVLLRLPAVAEACPNGLAPTSSTTMTLALGDALTVAAMSRKGFSRDDFGSRHPGGKLGRSLQTVREYLMGREQSVPTVARNAKLSDVVVDISKGRLGCVAVVDDEGGFAGMITDGDIRRAISPDFFSRSAADIMTASPTTFRPEQRISEVIATLTELRVSNAFVLDGGRPVGVLHTKDLLVEGYM
jgi:arabinose-5-phosphate isomerase